MCIICFKSKGISLPKEEHLRNCEVRNKDGIGIALLKDGKAEILIKKDFVNTDAFIAWFYANVTVDDACIVHYRFATHGLRDEGNRHPFPITKNKELLRKSELISQMVVAHNGIINQYGATTKFSDTQKFVLDILSDDTIKTNLDNAAVQKLISNFLGDDRLIILKADGMVYLWGTWHDVEGIKYSNNGYLVEKFPVGFGFNFGKTYLTRNSNIDGIIDICDGCGTKKFLLCNEETEYYMLCKSCRKKKRKGKLILKPIGNSITQTQIEEVTELQCSSCLDWFAVNEMVKYYGSDVCHNCLENIIRW